MRHRKSGRKFDTNSSHRKAMFRNMVTSLLVHGQIKTTTQRAKELRRVADRVISLGKRAPSEADVAGLEGAAQKDAKAARVSAIRRARRWVHDVDAVQRVFGEYADRFRTRPGGYTRIIKAGFRPGDNAEMAVIALVESLDVSVAAKTQVIEAAETVAADEEATVVASSTRATDSGPKGGKFDDMFEKYLESAKSRDADDVDEQLLRRVAKGIGPANYNADASRVSGTDEEEVETVKENFLVKKLGLEHGPELDEAIAQVVEWFGKSEKNKWRAVFYYKLVQRFGKADVYAD